MTYRVLFVVCAALALGVLATNPASSAETCRASWYKAGHTTASGRKFNKNDPTIVAHKKLKFGTRIKIENLDNGRVLIGRVWDRGPFVAGRCVDVTEAGAVRLGITHSGTAHVKVTVLN